MPDLHIQQLSAADIPEIVRIHRAAFPGSALTALGADTVQRYYAWLMDDVHDQADRVGAYDSGRLLGFCFGGSFRGAVSGYLRRNRSHLVRRVLTCPWLVGNAAVRREIGTALRLLLRPPPPASAPAAPSYGILAIAVDPDARRRGVGRQLMEWTEGAARRRGLPRMHLTVDPENNEALRFYERLGWSRTAEESGWHGKMEKLLDSSQEATAGSAPFG